MKTYTPPPPPQKKKTLKEYWITLFCGNIFSEAKKLEKCPALKEIFFFFYKIFIDRDPTAFAPILNFLRTKELDLRWDITYAYLLSITYPKNI